MKFVNISFWDKELKYSEKSGRQLMVSKILEEQTMDREQGNIVASWL